MKTYINAAIKFCITRPLLVLGTTALAVAASAYGVTHLKLKTSNLDLIGQNIPEVKRFLEFSEEFGNPNHIIVAFEGEQSQDLKNAADLLAPRLRSIDGVQIVLDKIPYSPEPYFLSNDQKMLFIFVQPKDRRTNVEAIAPLIQQINETIARANLDPKIVKVGLTGIPQYAIDDRDIIQKDISSLSFVSLGLVLMIFVAGFRSVRGPLLGSLTLGVSALLSLGVAYFYPGHLTLLSAPFAAMLFGLGDDYSIHIIKLMEEKIEEGLSRHDALYSAIVEIKQPLFTSALTTAGGFFILMQSGFLGFSELGFIAGVSVLICVVLMLTVFPALLSLFYKSKRPQFQWHSKIGDALVKPQVKILAVIVLLMSVAFLFSKSPRFDSNYLNLQPKNSNTVRLERRMIENSAYSPNFAVFKTKSAEEAATLAEKLREKKIVGEVRTISDITSFLSPGEELPRFPDGFLEIFISKKGNYAVYAYPQGNIWDPAVEKEFLSEMKSIDPNVTGMPFLGHFMIDQSKRALSVTTKLTIVLLIVILALDFRRPLLIVLAMLPPLLTGLWMRGWMNVLDIPFNPLNVMAMPIILGISVDYGVYILHRFLSDEGDIVKTLQGTGQGVVISSLTTTAAFGTLAFTSHMGLRSFSEIVAIGVTSALVISVVFFPWLLVGLKKRLLQKHRPHDLTQND